MEIFRNFVSEYATVILYGILTALATAAAKFVKEKYTEWANTKKKKEIAHTVVMAVQQMYKTLDGPAKKEKAVEGISAMLAEKGITISSLEIDMLIEATVGEFKNAFYAEDTETKELTLDEYIESLEVVE